ncbi:MAG: hypothetical protein EBR09_12170 [Proteobacteria bacterium]|nr:hypothetical protein [Pseudomonadota bacterium]
MKRFKEHGRFVPCTLCLIVFGSSSALASDSLDGALNLMLRLSDSNSPAIPAPEDCRMLGRIAGSAAASDELHRFKNQADSLIHKCLSPREDDSSAAAQVSPQDAVWDGVPLCGQDKTRTLLCEHNPLTGRGLFAYSSASSPENSPTLVCAHFEGTSRSPFDFLQEAGSRCVVTEFDWRYESSRSDVAGLKSWVKSPVGSAALQIPSLLKEQCSQVFGDSVYCTPTLVILPEKDPAQVTICSLETKDYRFTFAPVLQVNSLNSRWTCESKSLFLADKDQRLSVAERSCVPDHLGRLMNDYCRLPYMPVARKPVRTYIP